MMTETTGPEVLSVKRDRGIAGQYALTATVRYEGEEPESVTFVGSTYGGPIVMARGGVQYFVSRDVTDRIGSELTEAWVRAFFA